MKNVKMMVMRDWVGDGKGKEKGRMVKHAWKTHIIMHDDFTTHDTNDEEWTANILCKNVHMHGGA